MCMQFHIYMSPIERLRQFDKCRLVFVHLNIVLPESWFYTSNDLLNLFTVDFPFWECIFQSHSYLFLIKLLCTTPVSSHTRYVSLWVLQLTWLRISVGGIDSCNKSINTVWSIDQSKLDINIHSKDYTHESRKARVIVPRWPLYSVGWMRVNTLNI